ncbi:hypothetical protein [Arthrobacter sp. CP30]
MTTSLTQPRTPAGLPTGGQFSAALHAEPAVTLSTEDRQRELYLAATGALSVGNRTAAVREAINARDTGAETFNDGEIDLLDHLVDDDRALLKALHDNRSLEVGEQGDFGSILATDLIENAHRHEAAQMQAQWRSSPRPSVDVEPDLAYDIRDPKHPGFLDRVLG